MLKKRYSRGYTHLHSNYESKKAQKAEILEIKHAPKLALCVAEPELQVKIREPEMVCNATKTTKPLCKTTLRDLPVTHLQNNAAQAGSYASNAPSGGNTALKIILVLIIGTILVGAFLFFLFLTLFGGGTLTPAFWVITSVIAIALLISAAKFLSN